MKAGIADEIRVAAVFASYNRKDVALACIDRLRRQTRAVDLVVVADNASTDGSREAMEALGWERLVVLDTGGNLGNAGAVREAMEEAFKRGMDAVWILDDDSWPRTDALEQLIGQFDPGLVVHPVQVDPATGKFTWPMQVLGRGGWDLAWTWEDLPDGEGCPTRGAWTGAVIPRLVRECAGPVNGELFIRGEDEEYPWRIAGKGFGFRCVRGAVLDHPGPVGMRVWRLGGRAFFFEPGLAGWKLYYKVRNMVWLKRRQAGALRALAILAAYLLVVAWFDGLHRIPLVSRAALDGWQGRLGRADPGPAS